MNKLKSLGSVAICKIGKINQRLKSKYFMPVLILSITVIGAAIVIVSSAATTATAIEAESGTPTSGAQSLSHAQSSGGAHVKFGSVSTGTGRFRVQGGDIIDPDGKKFVPIGANVGPQVKNYSQWAFYHANGAANGHSDDALAWGWNMIRLNVVTDLPSDVTIQNMIDTTSAVIDEYTAKKIVVMPNSHSVTGSNTPMTDPKYQNINTFWDAILTKYRDNPYVWVNYVNEPIADFAKDNPLWANLGTQQYQRVRERAPNTMFVYDLPVWGQAINELALSNIGENFLNNKHNVVFSWHNYGGAIKYPSWDLGTYNDMSQWAQMIRNKNIAVLTGEFGRSSDPNTPPGTHNGQGAQIDIAADWTFDTWWNYGFGGLWWHGTGTPPDNWNLRMGNVAWFNQSFPLSDSGQRLRAIPGQRPAGL